jgi:putative protease
MLAKYDLKLIGNYTLNVYNCQTISTLQHLGISELTLSPELNDDDCKKLISSSNIPFELMVYGNIPLMTMNYCLLGKSNKCYSSCKHLCETKEKFYIKDRMNLNFRIVPDNLSTITTIYNSKITSFEYNNFNVDSVRISILDEEPSKIQNIINTVSDNKRFEGNKYCGHFNKFEAI